MSRQRVVAIASVSVAAVIIAATVAMFLPSQEKTLTPSTSNNRSSTASAQMDNESNSNSNTSAQISNIIYNVKFECGTIRGDEGPLRPGHYDTDIGILNKQDFPVKIQWSATANDGANTNSILRTLRPQSATGIVCNDLRQVLGNNESFVEGFVIIHVPVEPGLLGSLSGGATVLGRAEDINILEVQAFYTANALDELPHPVMVDKIAFVITNDTSGKIPAEIIGRTLDITVPSEMNEISDSVTKVKSVLAERYSLSEQDLAGVQIEIREIGVGVGTMIDDHAISLSKITPQAR
ncbi:MAG: hypothetical protein HRF40_13735 [Nitrososphaera sp.]